jgi:signal transduction histidine kinase
MRRRILALTVGLTTVVVLAFAIPLVLLLRQAAANDALAQARYRAENIAFFVGRESAHPSSIAGYIQRVSQDHPGVTQVLLPGGVKVGDQLPPVASAYDDHGGHDDDDDADGDGRPGDVSAVSVDYVDGGSITEVKVATPDGPAVVRTFLTSEELRDGLAPRLLLLGAVSLAILLLSVVAAEIVSKRLVRPLVATADTAQRLSKGETEARAPTTGPPEVAQVGTALNGLADRIDEVIAAEREAVADLSHRLRTPLTALRLDVEALPEPDREEISRHVTSLERTLTAVIHAARRPQREGRVPRCDAVAVVRDRVLFWTPLLEDQSRAVTLDLPAGEIPVRAAREDLAAAVDALVENVVAHTPEGTAMRVVVRAEPVAGGPGARVTFADEGPGIPLGSGERGRSDRGSTGLGLDIARRSAEATGGRIAIHAGADHGLVELFLAGAAQAGGSQAGARKT